MTLRHLTLRWGLLVLLGGATRNAQAQRMAVMEEPQPVRLQFTDLYLQMDMELEHEVQESGTPTTSVTRQRTIVQPVLGLGLNSSIYHPNLSQLRFNTELGLDWQETTMTPGGKADDSQFLRRYHGSVALLQEKPYATTFFADKDVTYRDYDFFSRVHVDSERYGARSGYSGGPVPFSVSAQHYEEFVDDPTRPTWFNEDTLNFSAQNQRRSGQGRTQLTYTLDQFSRLDNDYNEQHGLNQDVSLFDNEVFGRQDWVNLNSLLTYSSVSETLQPTARILFQENLRLEHSPKLRSFYEYAFDAVSAGDSDSTTHQGRIGLGHQTFKSLASVIDLHGTLSRSENPGNWADASRYGVSLSEQFSKPLGTWCNLTLGYNGRLDREERSTSGQVINVIGERHTLTDGTVTFLNQPLANVVSILVSDPNRTIIYIEGLDYLVTPRGGVTQIERIPGGRIANGGTVLVDYSAVLQSSAAYYSWDNTVNFRLDLWNGLLGIYGRWTILDYSGADELVLRWLNDKTIGVDSAWRWLRVGAEYEVADSNLAPYDRVRLIQSLQFQPGGSTTLGVDLDQNWTHFRDTGNHQNTYGFILRYQQQLTGNLAANAEGGVRIDRDFTFDRDIGVARLGLDWTLGKLTMRVGYQYANETQIASLTERHYFNLRIRRTF